MDEKERAKKCAEEIKATLNKYDFDITADWNFDIVIKSKEDGEEYFLKWLLR